MAAFGATPHGSYYIGGGDLWEEPEPPRYKWYEKIGLFMFDWTFGWFITGNG